MREFCVRRAALNKRRAEILEGYLVNQPDMWSQDQREIAIMLMNTYRKRALRWARWSKRGN